MFRFYARKMSSFIRSLRLTPTLTSLGYSYGLLTKLFHCKGAKYKDLSQNQMRTRSIFTNFDRFTVVETIGIQISKEKTGLELLSSM